MKHLFLGFCFFWGSTLTCLAQEDAHEKRPPFIIVQTGIGMQWFGESYKVFMLSAERPLGAYWHVGMQGTRFLNRESEYYYYYGDLVGGFEFSVYAKYFLHGRLSGRKSGLYLGPEFRAGSRRFQIVQDIFFPPSPTPNYIKHKEKLTKLMLRWGMQWQFGHATLELAVPFGVEFFTPKANTSLGYGNDNQFVMLPTLQLGVAF